MHRSDDITQTARTPRVPNVACATLRRDVLADSGNHIRVPVLQELTSDTRLGLTEAVTEESCAAGLLLPDRDTDVARAKPIAGLDEVPCLARRIGAEAVVRLLNLSKSDLRQQPL